MGDEEEQQFVLKPLLPPQKCRREGARQPEVPEQGKKHLTLGTPMVPPWPEGTETAVFGMGCFWCTEKVFAGIKGVFSTQVGFSGGVTVNPTYDLVCKGNTNHAEVARVIYDPSVVSYEDLLCAFWTGHDSTTRFQQNEDCGHPYRSVIYYTTREQRCLAVASREAYQDRLAFLKKPIVTGIAPFREFYYAEDEHQQYEAKHGDYYCGLCPLGEPLEPKDIRTAAAAAEGRALQEDPAAWSGDADELGAALPADEGVRLWEVTRGVLFKKARPEDGKIVKLQRKPGDQVATTGEVWVGPGGGVWAELDTSQGQAGGWLLVRGGELAKQGPLLLSAPPAKGA
uniref:peptide-methionine (S)-S-oxide reductase n=1 Tax=Alexandrium monilatum TaxID=311494 RepID=A0A7S4RB11_9DINO